MRISFNLPLLCYAFLTVTTLTSCMDASITKMFTDSGSTILPPAAPLRSEVGFIAGQIVTTNNGVVIKGAFNETSEKMKLKNDVQIEGVFYE